MDAMDDIRLRIGQAAELVGVTPKTIRHYHKIGLLPPAERSENNYRQYGVADLYRLKLILRLKAVGFSLAEIRSILGAEDADTVLQQRLGELEEQLGGRIVKLKEQRERVRALLAAGATLRDVDRPEVQASITYELLADVLEGYATGSAADVAALDRALLARLDIFNWGEAYRAYWLGVAHALADSVDVLHSVGERVVEAEHLAASDPQLEQMADEIAGQLETIQASFVLPEMERPWQELFKKVVANAIQETFTPAQKRLIGLIRERLHETFS